jgi:NitT/TauT family transport system substrate-binding protein
MIHSRRRFLGLAVAGAVAIGLAACGSSDDDSSSGATTAAPATTAGTTTTAGGATTTSGEKVTLRLGYFPNITHSTALVGVGNGIFEEKLGDNVELETQTFNAGPAAVEALFAGAIDATYIGPNPAINAFAQSNGEAVRIISGATSGGAFLVTKPDITSVEQLKGKKIATPQLGNTQDVALRAWLKEQGYTTDTAGGGDVSVVPQDNAQTLQTFIDGQIDGAWLPEPWASRLILEGGAKVFLDERELWPEGKYVTTHLIVATKFLEDHPDVVKRLLEGQVAANEFVNGNAAEAQKVANAEIGRVTSKPLKEELIQAVWPNLTFTNDPVASSLQKSATDAQEVGLLKPVDLNGIYDLALLNEVLTAAGEPPVQDL